MRFHDTSLFTITDVYHCYFMYSLEDMQCPKRSCISNKSFQKFFITWALKWHPGTWKCEDFICSCRRYFIWQCYHYHNYTNCFFFWRWYWRQRRDGRKGCPISSRNIFTIRWSSKKARYEWIVNNHVQKGLSWLLSNFISNKRGHFA